MRKIIAIVLISAIIFGGIGYLVNGKLQAKQAEDQFATQLKTQPQELQDAYAKGGLDSYNKAVDVYLTKQAFITQYGKDSTIDQLVVPNQVYAAAWTSKDGSKHISWSIGGLWVEVTPPTKPTQPPQTENNK